MRASSSAASGTTSASSRAVARAGVASTTASACSTSASRVEPTTRFQPPSAARARSRTVAPVRTSRPAEAATAPRQPADAADEAGEHGHVGGLLQRVGGRPHQRAVPVEQRDDLRHRGAGGDLAGVAGVDAAEQRLDEPVDDLAAEPLLDQPADADVLAVERVAGSPRPSRPGPGPRRTARRCRRARGRRPARPSACAASAAAARATRGSRSWWPGARCGPPAGGPGQVDGLGPAVEHRLGADVDGDAADLGERELAADGWVRPRAPRPPRRAPSTDGRRRREPGDAGADHDHARRRRHGATGSGGGGHGHRFAKPWARPSAGWNPAGRGLRHRGSRAAVPAASNGTGHVMGATGRSDGSWRRARCSRSARSRGAAAAAAAAATRCRGRAGRSSADRAAPAPASDGEDDREGRAGRRRAPWCGPRR